MVWRAIRSRSATHIIPVSPDAVRLVVAVSSKGTCRLRIRRDWYDVITGTMAPDVIVGLQGNDVIKGLEGNDTICGGRGQDKVYGGFGHDRVFGNNDNDLMQGGYGDDRVGGDGGNDRVAGEWGSDLVYGMAGSDRMYGGGLVSGSKIQPGDQDFCNGGYPWPGDYDRYVNCPH
jgi:hypothetical protein